MIYLSDSKQLAVPEVVERSDWAAKSRSGRVWKVLSLQRPVVGRKITDIVQLLAPLISGTHERTLEEQAQEMGIGLSLSTGREVPGITDEFSSLITESLEREEKAERQTGETADEEEAKGMDQNTFWKHFAAILPGGLPGSDAPCTAP